MPNKTYAEQELESQRGFPVEQIIRDALDGLRGQTQIAEKLSVVLGVSKPTIYSWCAKYGIDIDEYRREGR